jgi:mannosyl-glycoprotein endo-beta-N-acetylglucosaminidase
MAEKKHRYYKDYKKPEETIDEEKPVAPKKPKKVQKKVKTTSRLNVRSAPVVGNNIIKTLSNGTVVTVLSEKDGWSEIDGGFVMSKYLESVK